jgi:RNA polymerase sigma-70 factor (ECF subfamily)
MPSNKMPITVDDPDFAKRIRENDAQAIELAVRTYLPQIVRAAQGAGLDLDRAEDVAQSTFVIFIEKAGTFDGRSHVRTWLFGILYRKIMEERRHLKRDEQHDDIDETVDQRFTQDGRWLHPPRRVDTTMQQSQVRDSLRECLDSVPFRQRLVFVLREAEGFSTKEICNILDVSRTNLGAMLYRCRNRLRECLEAKGIKGSDDAKV